MSIRRWTSLSLFSAVLATALTVAPRADALSIFSDRASFEAASGPLSSEGFEAAFAAAPSVDFGPFTANVGFADVVSANGASHPQFVSEGDRALYAFDATQPSTIGNTMIFTFDTPIHAFGIDVNDFSSGLLDLQGTGSDPLLITPLWTTASDGAPPATIFFGVVDPMPFSQVTIFWNRAQDAVGFDDLAWSTSVPEPGTGLLMWTVALVGLGVRQRRARACRQ
ncbi:MAG: PEP-CTERM sorting domain-containing protein [Myxococcota bacterium]